MSVKDIYLQCSNAGGNYVIPENLPAVVSATYVDQFDSEEDIRMNRAFNSPLYAVIGSEFIKLYNKETESLVVLWRHRSKQLKKE